MQQHNQQNKQELLIPAGDAWRLRWLLALATILLGIGLVTPMLTITQFIIIGNSFSVLSGIYELLRNDHILLFFVVTLFSVVLPMFKLLILFWIVGRKHVRSEKIRRYLHLMHDYGRWSMLDVLVVAILIVAVKLGTIATIQVHYGLYVFAAAVLLIMYITNRIVSLTNE